MSWKTYVKHLSLSMKAEAYAHPDMPEQDDGGK